MLIRVFVLVSKSDFLSVVGYEHLVLIVNEESEQYMSPSSGEGKK